MAVEKNSDGTLVGLLLESLSLSQSTLEESVQVWMVETNPRCKRKKNSNDQSQALNPADKYED
jgi:hypothetical protein